jgi:N-acyl-D-amino-acid deacylase
MRAAVREALQAGALGMSSGTFYPPAAAAPARELVQVGADLQAAGGVYATHLRNEGDEVLEAIDEAATVAKALGVPLVISHHKVMGVRNFGRTEQTLRRIALLRELQPVCMDCYPYTASSSLLRPERLAQSDEIIVTSSRSTPEAAGRSITQLAGEWDCSREEALRRVMPGTGVYFMMHEDDVRRVLAEPTAMIGSDGISSDAHPHPRLWGTFARVLGRYCRDEQLFSLESAVHKMTGLTARAFGLRGRGELKPGNAADLALFDPGAIADRATYEQPRIACEGMVGVWVNGICVWHEGRSTGALPGQCLRR